MFSKFLWLEWKSFTRSASFGKSIGIKILMIFLALYFSALFLFLGVALFPILKDAFPGQDPLAIVNRYALAYLIFELVFRFMLQNLPVLDIKPIMVLPLTRKKTVNFVLLKSLYSFYNLLPLFWIVPFSLSSIIKYDYRLWNVLGWMLGFIGLILCVNYFNFIIKKRFNENLKQLLPVLVGIAILTALDYFDVLDIGSYFGAGLDFLYEQPFLAVVPFILLIILYRWNLMDLSKKFYLDQDLQSKSKEVNSQQMDWTRRFGSMAPYLQLDLKLILRNKRAKTTIYMSLLLLCYGLIFYPNDTYQDMPAFLLFVGIFMTGVFMMNFGQFVPSWDSSYYQMIMSQNIPMRQYLGSKMGLITVSVIIMLILTTPYVYFGWDIVLLNVTAALYNIGVNIPMLIFAGSFNKKRIDLNKSPVMNYQGMGVSQWLIGIPVMALPVFMFWLVDKFISFEAAVGFIAILGIAGIILRPALLTYLTQRYRSRKYVTIQGFKQQGD